MRSSKRLQFLDATIVSDISLSLQASEKQRLKREKKAAKRAAKAAARLREKEAAEKAAAELKEKKRAEKLARAKESEVNISRDCLAEM